VLQVRPLSVRFDIGPPPGVAHAHPHRSKTVPLRSVRSKFPSKAALEKTPKPLPQSGLYTAASARKDPRVSGVFAGV
jgi:hypothetical protein